MAKDSYWFRHDSTAGRGMRMRKIAFIYGHWGKGVYWDVVEVLRDQENYRYSSDEFDLKMLADLIGCKDDSKFINWFNDCVKFDLLIVDNGEFYSEVLCDNMKRWEASKANGSKGGRPPKQKPNPKPRINLTNNLDETIIEEDSIEEDKNSIEYVRSYFIGYATKNNLNQELVLDQLNLAWEYYEEKSWFNSKGKEVKDRKGTIRNNWFKDLTKFKIRLPPIDKLVAHVALQVPTEKQKLLGKGYSIEEIKKYAQ